MQLNRRELLLGATAGALVMSSTAHAKPVVDVPPFAAPTAKNPMLLCFNENPLGMSLKAKVAAKMPSIMPPDTPLFVLKLCVLPAPNSWAENRKTLCPVTVLPNPFVR